MSVVGVIGVGRMGGAVCERLASAGHDVSANDVRAEREAVAIDAGARWAESLAELLAGAEIVITVLPGASELLDVAAELGTLAGVRAAPPRSGPIWIDMTSVSPTVGAQARALLACGSDPGREMIEALIGGSADQLRAGAAELFVGGTADAVDEVRPVLDALGIVHQVGGPGAGYVTKLLVNLLWFGQAVATTEALLLGARCGVDPETLAGVLGASPTDGSFIRRDLDAVLDGDHLPEFAFDRCCEQLHAITKLAHEQGVPFTVSDAVWLVHERALERFGPVDGELMAVAHLQSEAGISLRRGSRTSYGVS